jgi:hypothetical protein
MGNSPGRLRGFLPLPGKTINHGNGGMGVLLVICQLGDPTRRDRIWHEIGKRHRTSVRLTEGAYALETELLPVRVFDQLKDHLGPDDRLYVLPIGRPFTGYGPRPATEWLSTFLPLGKGL